MAALRAEALLRTLPGHGQTAVEPYHDQVRTAALAALDELEQAQRHRRLADAWGSRRDAEPEVMFTHLIGAGDHGAAVPHGVRAADKADAALAFGRAAELYESVLGLVDHAPDARKQLLTRLGSAQAAASRGNRAADAYLEAAGFCEGRERSELRWMAMEQWMVSFNIDEAMKLVPELVPELGIVMETPTEGTLAARLGKIGSARWITYSLQLRHRLTLVHCAPSMPAMSLDRVFPSTTCSCPERSLRR